MRTEQGWLDLCKEHINAGHTPGGSKEATYTTRFFVLDRLCRWGFPLQGKTIVDYGCGNGRLAMALNDLRFNVHYHGVDIIEPSIEFCKLAFMGISDYQFYHVNVYSDHYWKRGHISAEQIKLPFENNFADIVFMNSVFTHIFPPAACVAIMTESLRILKNNGEFIATWLKSPPNKVSQFTRRTVYKEDQIKNMYRLAGYTIADYYGGDTTARWDQMVIHAKP